MRVRHFCRQYYSLPEQIQAGAKIDRAEYSASRKTIHAGGWNEYIVSICRTVLRIWRLQDLQIRGKRCIGRVSLPYPGGCCNGYLILIPGLLILTG
jgi:hypothetical protein